MVNIWNQGKTYTICMVKTPTKCSTGVTFGHLSWFSQTKSIKSFFLFQRLLYKKYDYEKKKKYVERFLYKKYDYEKKKNICWRITSAARNLTSNPPTFHEEKNSSKRRDCEICNLIKVVGYSKIDVHLFKKKVIFLKFFTFAFRKKLTLIILVQCLHSIITYVGCVSSL